MDPTFRTEEEWEDIYKKQRRDRLQDSVDEYIQDGASPEDFKKDLIYCLNDVIIYHSLECEKATQLKLMVENGDD